jgi:hypothetical protein
MRITSYLRVGTEGVKKDPPEAGLFVIAES